MTTQPPRMLILVAIAAVLAHAGTAFAQTARFEALSNLPFSENRPTSETAQTLRDELLFQRATQTYLWGLPLINCRLRQALEARRHREGAVTVRRRYPDNPAGRRA